MTRIFLDVPLFYRSFPELKSADSSFLKTQWPLIVRYIAQHPAVFRDPGVSEHTKLLAHVVKLNLMAQMGMKIDGTDVPIVMAPDTLGSFRNWLQQTSYGQSLG